MTTSEKTLFVSDLHLKGLLDPRARLFIQFLTAEQPGLRRLVIGGDLFDFWVGRKSVVYYEHLPVLNKLLELHQSGVEIYYVEGNHDFSLGPFFEEVCQVRVIKNEGTFMVDGKKIWLSHGDLVNRKDIGYLFLRAFLRSKPVQLMIRVLPPAWLWVLSKISSHASRTYRKPDAETQSLFQSYAKNKLQTRDIDVVMMGHTHEPDEQVFQIHGKTKYYFNTGDWITHFTYVEYAQGSFALKKFVFDRSLLEKL